MEKNVVNRLTGIFGIFWAFFDKFATIKNFFQKSKSVHHPHTFVPNLTLLGLLSSEILFGEKTVTHPDRHPAYFAVRESPH